MITVVPGPGLTRVQDPRHPNLYITAAGMQVSETDYEIQRLIASGDLVVTGSSGGGTGGGGETGQVTGSTLGMLVGLFTAISTVFIPAGTDVIRTSGYSAKGVGGAYYVATTNTGATAWRAQSANGRWFELASDEIPTPAKFGAPLNGTDNDLPAIQAAVTYVQTVRGRGQVHLEDRTYHCSSGTIIVDPTLCGLYGRGAKLDFGARATTNPATMPELNPDPTFASTSGWIAGTLAQSAHPWVISGNAATHTIPDAGPSNNGYYNDFGRQMAGVQASTTYTATFTVASISNGGSNQDYVELRVLDGSGGPANNGIGFGAGLAYSVSAPGTYTVVFTTPATVPAGGAWVGFQTNNNVQITGLSIKQVPNNTLLLVQAQSSSPAYGHEPFSWGGFEIAGAGSASYAVAMEFNTLAGNGPSSRGQYYNIAIHDVNVGMSFENQTYCLDFYGCSIWNTATCVAVQAVTTNAGEEVCFHSCKLFNSTLAISNPGSYELVFFGGSLDYCAQWYVGGGVATFNDVHFEKQQPSGATNYPFDLKGSCDVVIRGGTILVTPSGPNSYFFNTSDKFSRIVLDNVKGYGWPAATGQLLGGPGQLIVDGRILWGANHAIAGQLSANSFQNLYGTAGDFEGSSIGVMAWVDPVVGTTRIGSTSVSAISGQGNGVVSNVYAPAPLVPGKWTVKFTSATAFTVTKPNGQVDGTGTVGTTYLGGIQFLVTAGGTAFAAGSSFTVTVSGYLRYGAAWQNSDGSIYASATLSQSTAQAYSGTKSLQFLKGIGGGTIATFNLACDFQPRAQAVQQFQYKIPPIAGASAGNVTLWVESYFAKMLGFDAQGLPIMGPDQVHFGETTITFDPTVGTAWALASGGTLYSDESSPTNGVAPDWCNCLLFNINPINTPQGFAMFIDALSAWQFGG